MSSGCAHPVDHCMCAHRVDHWMCAPSGPLDVCICITTTCKHPRAHRKPYIRWSTRCSYIWWTTSSPLVVIRMQRHLVDHRMCKSLVYLNASISVPCATDRSIGLPEWRHFKRHFQTDPDVEIHAEAQLLLCSSIRSETCENRRNGHQRSFAVRGLR